MECGVVERAAALLVAAQRVLVLTGAGLSQESGVPTFRGGQGLWDHHHAEDLATPEAFDRMPERVWAWYRWRLEQIMKARPNAGHLALARLSRRRPTTVLNQNVDGLLEEAYAREGGVGDLLALHGSIRLAHCQRCRSARSMVELPEAGPPRCPCGGLMRPSVVWFGERLNPAHLARLDQEAGQADLVLAVGTAALVWPAASVLPEARRSGRPVVVVNPDPAAAEAGDLHLEGRAAELLPLLVDGLKSEGL